MAGTTTSASSARSTTGVRCIIVTPETTVLDTRGRFVSLPLFDGGGLRAQHLPEVLEYGDRGDRNERHDDDVLGHPLPGLR